MSISRIPENKTAVSKVFNWLTGRRKLIRQLRECSERYEKLQVNFNNLELECKSNGLSTGHAAAFSFPNWYTGSNNSGNLVSALKIFYDNVQFSNRKYLHLNGNADSNPHPDCKVEPSSGEVYEPLGWIVSLDLNNLGANSIPFNIESLHLKAEYDGSTRKFSSISAVAMPLVSKYIQGGFFDEQVDNEFLSHRIYNLTGGYFNYLTEETDQTRNFQFFSEDTHLVFFSRHQLCLAYAYISSLENPEVVRPVFSGYKLNTGRMVSTLNMNQLDTLSKSPGEKDWHNWFSLKLELVIGQAIEEGDLTNDQPRRDELIDEYNPVKDPNVPSSGGSNPCFTDYDSEKLPMTFFGQACPPTWFAVGNILESLSEIATGNGDLAEIAEELCVVLDRVMSSN